MLTVSGVTYPMMPIFTPLTETTTDNIVVSTLIFHHIEICMH